MQAHELFDKTLYLSLAVLPLKQQSLVKIAGTLLSRHHIAHEVIEIMLHWHALLDAGGSYTEWRRRWKNFRARISDDIDRLPYKSVFKSDYRDTTMHLLRNILNFPNPKIFNPAITMKFTARGDLDLRWMFEDYTTRTLSVPNLPQEKKYELLADACHLYQEQCVQSILCDLLNSERSALVTLLSNAGRSLEIQKDYSRWSWIISFELDDVNRGSWDRFITTLNSRHLEDVTFSFEQNLMKVTTWGRLDHVNDIIFLWPKLTTNDHKCQYAVKCSLSALYNSDTLLFIRTIRFLNSAAKMELIDLHVLIVMTFLKHPHDRYFLPDLQLDSAGDWTQQIEKRSSDIFNLHILEVYLDGNVCSDRRDALLQLWRYTLSRNKTHGDRMLLSIKRSLDDFVKENPLYIYEDDVDVKKVIKVLFRLFPFPTAAYQISEDIQVLLIKGAFSLLLCFMLVIIIFDSVTHKTRYI